GGASPGSSHPPPSPACGARSAGATILVKLHQFDPEDRTHVRIATDKAVPVAAEGRPGVAVLPLFADGREEVRIERWAPGARIALQPRAGLELFVLEGAVEEGGARLEPWDWLRLPVGADLEATAGPEGARVWIKTDHLGTA
ncbi:MAG: cupin, partial [Pseudomonadota bacterium]